MKDANNGGLIESKVWLIKTCANGDTLWTKTFGYSLNDWGNSVQQTNDGGYIITGVRGRMIVKGFGHGGSVWLIKTDKNGDSLWTKTFGEGDSCFICPGEMGNSVQQTTDGGYIIAGRKPKFSSRSVVWLIKTDDNGDTLWTNTFEKGAGYSVQQTADGGYIIAGQQDNNFLVIKIAPDITSIDESPQVVINDYRLQQNYPNPFNPVTTINYSIPREGLVTLKVYNVLGEEVDILVNEIKQVGNYETNFDASSLSSGVYLYKIQAGNYVEAKKTILLR